MLDTIVSVLILIIVAPIALFLFWYSNVRSKDYGKREENR